MVVARVAGFYFQTHSNLRASAKNYGGCRAKSEADFHFHVSLIVSVRVVLGRSVVGDVSRGSGSVMASWLERSTRDRAVQVRALAGHIMLCSWERNLTITEPLTTQEFKWVPAGVALG